MTDLLIETLTRSRKTEEDYQALAELLLNAIALDVNEETGQIDRIEIRAGETTVALDAQGLVFRDRELSVSLEEIHAGLLLLVSLKDLLPPSTDGTDEDVPEKPAEGEP